MISRRRFVATTAAVFAAPRAAGAQPTGKVARVGWLETGTTGPPLPRLLDGFREGLRDGGWVEGRNLVIEFRTGPAEGSLEARLQILTQLATELVNLKPDVILASIAGAANAAKRAVHAIPVVFVGVSDPVGFGLVASLAKPGGNFTGVSLQSADLNPKRLGLVREAVPGVTQIAALIARDHPLRESMLKALQSAARATNVSLYPTLTNGPDPAELDRAFAAIRRDGVGAVVGLPVALYIQHRHRIAELAIKHRLPTILSRTASPRRDAS